MPRCCTAAKGSFQMHFLKGNMNGLPEKLRVTCYQAFPISDTDVSCVQNDVVCKLTSINLKVKVTTESIGWLLK
jgi:hypothetical protein